MTPHLAAIYRVLWKEYRHQRGVWLVLMSCAVAVQLLVAYFAAIENRPVPVEVLYAIAVLGTGLFALAIGATLFAAEHDTETFETLRALPVSNGQLFCGKFFGALAGLALMPIVLFVAAFLCSRNSFAGTGLSGEFWIAATGIIISLFVWGLFFSLWMKQPLWAMAYTAGTVGIVYVVSFYLYDRILTGIVLHGSLDLVILGIDICLALRWLDEHRGSASRWHRRESASASTAKDRPYVFRPRTRAFGRLLWQGWRQSKGMLLGLFCPLGLLAAVFLCTGLVSHDAEAVTIPFMTLPVVAAILGGCVFLGDQSRQGFRFFAERGVNPRRVWFSRHVMWIGCLVMWTVVCAAIVASSILIAPAKFLSHPSTVGVSVQPLTYSTEIMSYAIKVTAMNLFWGILGLSIVAYSAAQIGSCYLRSGVVGLFVGLMLAGIACAWCWLMTIADVPLIWSAAPLPIFSLWGTWLRAPDWVAENSSARASLRAALALGSPLVLVASVILYRVYEIPSVTLPSLAEVSRLPTVEERATAKMYEEAMELLERFRRERSQAPSTIPAVDSALGQPASPVPDHSGALAEKTRSALIDKFVAASGRPTCRFRHPGLTMSNMPSYGPLGRFVLDWANELSNSGKHREARQLNLALIRYARHLYQSETAVHQAIGDQIERDALEQIVHWSAHKERTPDEIRDVVDELNRECFSFQPRREQVPLHDYYLLSQLLDEPEKMRWIPPEHDSYRRIMAWVPWEKARVNRLLAYHASAVLSELEFVKSELRRDAGISARPESMELQRKLESSLLVNRLSGNVRVYAFHVAMHEMFRRATKARLEILWWRAKHGELPGYAVRTAPKDPFTGEPFVYRPEGLGMGVQRNNWWHEPEVPYLPAGTPFIWSAGPQLIRNQSQYRIDPEEAYLMYSRRLPDGSSMPLQTSQEMYQLGIAFEIEPIKLTTP